LHAATITSFLWAMMNNARRNLLLFWRRLVVADINEGPIASRISLF
jgi:hypothetical protein